jgi:hypothetical protein
MHKLHRRAQMFDPIRTAQNHPPRSELLPLPGLLEVENWRIANPFVGEPLVPFVAGSRHKCLGQEVLAWS